VQASTLGVLTLVGDIRIWQILLLGFLYGAIMAFETPARQSLISQDGELARRPAERHCSEFRTDEQRTIDWPSIARHVAGVYQRRMVFPDQRAEPSAAIIASVSMMRLAPRTAPAIRGLPPAGPARRGAYAWHTRPIRLFLALVALISLTASAYTVLMPMFARDVFGGDAAHPGFSGGQRRIGRSYRHRVSCYRGRIVLDGAGSCLLHRQPRAVHWCWWDFRKLTGWRSHSWPFWASASSSRRRQST
jgi:hypothetical protein